APSARQNLLERNRHIREGVEREHFIRAVGRHLGVGAIAWQKVALDALTLNVDNPVLGNSCFGVKPSLNPSVVSQRGVCYLDYQVSSLRMLFTVITRGHHCDVRLRL